MLQELKKRKHTDITFWYRPNTDDELILKELIEEDMYQMVKISPLLAHRNNVILLDIGAHIGVFSKLWLHYFHFKAVCYEPITSNFELLQKNSIENEMESRQMAVTTADGTAQMQLVNSQYTGRWKVENDDIIDNQKQETKMVSINKVLEEFSENAIVLKIDIEGLEYDLLKAIESTNWDKVVMLFLEWHDTPIPHSFFAEKGFCFLFHPKAQKRHAVYIRPHRTDEWIQTFSGVLRTLAFTEDQVRINKVIEESQWTLKNFLRRLNMRFRRLVD